MNYNEIGTQMYRCRECGKPTLLWNDHFCVTEYYVSTKKVFTEPYWKILFKRLKRKLFN